eukprot:SAG11_NODE_36291_length_262_cov_0.926380_1_plen_33_part_01
MEVKYLDETATTGNVLMVSRLAIESYTIPSPWL